MAATEALKSLPREAAQRDPLRLQPGNIGNWSGHIPLAFALVHDLRPAVIVELGVHYGESYFAFCQAVADHKLPTRCFGVDHWKGDAQAAAYGEDVYEDVSRHNTERYAAFSSLLRKPFDEARADFEDASIGLLHIDGLHTYEAVRHDFEAWWPKVRPGGVVLLHDIEERHDDFGVWKLWDELCAQWPHAAFTHNHGLGLIRKPSDTPPPAWLHALMSPPSADHAAVRAFFEAAGQRLMDRGDARRFHEVVSALGVSPNLATQRARALVDHERTMAGLKAQSAQLQQQLEEKALVQEALQQRNAELTQQLQASESQHAEAMQQRADAERRLRDTAAIVATLEAEKADAQASAQRHAEMAEGLAAQLTASQSAARETAERLHAIEQSRVWRMTAPIRALLGRLRARAMLDRMLGLTHHMRLQPVREIAAQGQDYRSLGHDPQFLLHTDRETMPEGWVLVRYRQAVTNGDWSPVFYADNGAGFSEHSVIAYPETADGAYRHVLRLPLGVKALRFDPMTGPGDFRLEALTMRQVGKRRLLMLLFGHHICARWRHPHRLFDFFKACARHVRTHDTHGLKMLLLWGERDQPSSAGNGILTPEERYACWLKVNPWTPKAEAQLKQRLDEARDRLPRLSVVMPVCNPPLKHWRRAVESVRQQVYSGWELCMADDASDAPNVADELGRMARADSGRLRFVQRPTRGHISEATNSAAELAMGDFLVLLDQDDELSPNALGEIALYLAEHPDTDFLYTDSDKIDEHGHRYDPHFKPDASPELLLSYMYAGQALAIRRTLYEKLGGLRKGFEGCQDHDLALRACEQARHVGHLPLVLYHWRCLPGSTASSGHAKAYSFEAGRKAVQGALDRRGSRGRAYQPDWARQNGNALYWIEFPDEGPSVTLIIPTRNNEKVLRRCIDSLKRTTYRNYNVLIVDNESDDSDTRTYLASLPHRIERIGNPDGRFNFARLMNEAARRCDADYVLFLNDDTEVIESRWLSRMVGYGELPGVGTVGALLRYPDGRVQHAGVGHGFHDGLAGHLFKLLPRGQAGYLGGLNLSRNCSAVSAACMLTPRKVFLDHDGFDAERFAVAYNDPDYAYRLGDEGLRSVYCPGAELIHHEGTTRGFKDDVDQVAAYRRIHGHRIDPYYNPNLSLLNEQVDIRPRRVVIGRTPPPRVLACTHNLNHEGAPRFLTQMLCALHERGDIRAVVWSPTEGPLRQELEQADIPIEIGELPLIHGTETPYFGWQAHVQAICEKYGVDVIHANTLQVFYAVDFANRLNIPSLWTVHESEPWQTYFDFAAPDIAKRALACFTLPYRVVFVAHATLRAFQALEAQANFTVVHNGLHPDLVNLSNNKEDRSRVRAERQCAPEDVVFLCLGSVCERKGQRDLVDALALMDESLVQRARILIVGDRGLPYGQGIQRAIDRLPENQRAHIQLIPHTDDPQPYFQAADVFVCTSRIESYPYVTLEAMAHELPIVTTPAWGIPEQVREGINALFYEPGNAHQLTKRLQQLIEQPEHRATLSRRSRHVLASLPDFDTMIQRYAQLYREARLTR